MFCKLCLDYCLYYVCIKLGCNMRFLISGEYYGMDHDGYQHAVTDKCLEETGHDSPEDRVFQSQETYNPYDVHMGQMTVYRCENINDILSGEDLVKGVSATLFGEKKSITRPDYSDFTASWNLTV